MTPGIAYPHSILRHAALAAILAAFTLAIGFTLMPRAASANGGIIFPVCPIEDREDRLIFPLDPHQFLYGAGSESGPFLVDIPAGTYDITLASFDSHSEKGGQGQEHERWQLKLTDASGILLGVTSLIHDLPDADDVLVERVDTEFVVPAAIAQLRPFHPDGGNSIRPLCAAFDIISTTHGGNDAGGEDSNNSVSGDTTSDSTPFTPAQTQGESGASCSECGGIGGGGVTVTPLLVSEERARWIGHAIVVTWKTNIPAMSRVYYGTTSVEPPTLDQYLGYATSTEFATTTSIEHTVQILDADQRGVYYLRPASQEESDQSFRTVGSELRLLPVAPATAGTGGAAATVSMISMTTPNVFVERGEVVRTCGAHLTSFIRPNVVNNLADVANLQLFLWQYEGFRDVLINGVYDERTRAAVEEFQIRYAADILIPWGLTTPTGHVYLTTQKKINELFCKHARGTEGEFTLGGAAQEEIRGYREMLEAERRELSAAVPGGEGMSEVPPDAASTSTPDFRVEPFPSVGRGESPDDGSGPERSERGVLDGAALIVEKIGDRFATATRNGLIGAFFAGFKGPSTPTFLGILSLVLLIAGALMLVRSLRSRESRDSDRNSTLPPPPPTSGTRGPGPSSSESRIPPPPAPFEATRSRMNVPPSPPVEPRTHGSSSATGASSTGTKGGDVLSHTSVFQMPPRRETYGGDRGAESESLQPIAPLLRGRTGTDTPRPSVGPATPSA